MRTTASSVEHTTPATWPEAVQILVTHAAACLAHLTATRTAQAMRFAQRRAATTRAAPSGTRGCSFRRSSCINEAAVRVGRENRDLIDRLRPEIDRARKLYEERVPAAPASATRTSSRSWCRRSPTATPHCSVNPRETIRALRRGPLRRSARARPRGRSLQPVDGGQEPSVRCRINTGGIPGCATPCGSFLLKRNAAGCQRRTTTSPMPQPSTRRVNSPRP